LDPQDYKKGFTTTFSQELRPENMDRARLAIAQSDQRFDNSSAEENSALTGRHTGMPGLGV